MKVWLAPDVRKWWQCDAFNALQEGLIRHGIRVAEYDDVADFSVYWGENAPPHMKDRPVLYLEAGYINGASGKYVADRLRFVSTSWNGLHGRASSLCPDAPPDRFDSLGIRLQEWRVRPCRVKALLLGQVPGDRCAPGPDTWLRIVERARSLFDVVEVRPHPLVKANQPPLLDALRDVDVCVTWASTAAVEAVLAGVPTVTLSDWSIARPVTSHKLDGNLRFVDRRSWAYNLAYRQWTHDELADGTAWEWLKHGIDVNHRAGSRTDLTRRGESAYPSHA